MIGGAATVDTMRYPVATEHSVPLVTARERADVLVSMLKRGAQFRHDVIAAYDRRCAVSGFGLGSVPASKASGLLDAAHIHLVGDDGSDHVSNGLPLTPTLHRLLMPDCSQMRYQDGRPRMRRRQSSTGP